MKKVGGSGRQQLDKAADAIAAEASAQPAIADLMTRHKTKLTKLNSGISIIGGVVISEMKHAGFTPEEIGEFFELIARHTQ